MLSYQNDLVGGVCWRGNMIFCETLVGEWSLLGAQIIGGMECLTAFKQTVILCQKSLLVDFNETTAFRQEELHH